MSILKKLLFAVSVIFQAVSVQAQEDWAPTGVWPFVHKNFRTAKVTYGFLSNSTTTVPCNIHIGNQSLWFSRNDTLLEALPGNIKKIEFKDETYIPASGGKYLGRVVREDTLQGKMARLIMVQTVDQHRLDQDGVDMLNKTQNILQSSGFLSSFCADIADANAGVREEDLPIPLHTMFFMLFKGDFFEMTTKNILAHVNPERRSEYKAYTRSAEIISTNESSMVKIWNDFFVNYDKPLKKKP